MLRYGHWLDALKWDEKIVNIEHDLCWLVRYGWFVDWFRSWLVDRSPSFDLLGVRDDIETYQIAVGMR